jgi:hypothetical protein
MLVFLKVPGTYLQMLKYLRDGKTQEDKADAAVTAELKARLDAGEVLSQAELLSYGQTNYNTFQSINEANKSSSVNVDYKNGEKRLIAWMQQDPRDTKAISELGGGLNITQVDKVKTEAEVRILNELPKIYRKHYRNIARAGGDDAFRTGEVVINGKTVKIADAAYADSIK